MLSWGILHLPGERTCPTAVPPTGSFPADFKPAGLVQFMVVEAVRVTMIIMISMIQS